jgi:predicted nucleic acid-binding protein
LSDLICDTSPIQYLYQLGLLEILPALGERIFVPPVVVEELAAGRSLGISLPDIETLNWMTIQCPTSEIALPLVAHLGPGETEVLMLMLEMPGAVAVLDDRVARQIAETLELRFTGTLGLLLDAKNAGLVTGVRPLLDRLNALQFRLAHHTYEIILRLADEAS